MYGEDRGEYKWKVIKMLMGAAERVSKSSFQSLWGRAKNVMAKNQDQKLRCGK